MQPCRPTEEYSDRVFLFPVLEAAYVYPMRAVYRTGLSYDDLSTNCLYAGYQARQLSPRPSD